MKKGEKIMQPRGDYEDQTQTKYLEEWEDWRARVLAKSSAVALQRNGNGTVRMIGDEVEVDTGRSKVKGTS